MDDIKPIKRSKELAPLSREHHDGLQFVWKIRQGLANNTPPELIRDFIRWFWSNHLEPHFNNEEKVLLQYIAINNPLIMQMVKEHGRIRDMISSPDHREEKETLTMLAEFIYNHIRFEERELFAYVEKTLTPEQLSSIYMQLENGPHCDTDPMAVGWKEEFWMKKK